MTNENNARPTPRVGEQVSSESGPRGNVDREDDGHKGAPPPPIDRRGTEPESSAE